MSFDKSKIMVSKSATAREVTFSDGTTETLHFLVPSAADVRRWNDAEQGDDEAAKVYGMQRLIAASLYDPEKKSLVLTGDDYKGLNYEGCTKLLPHVLEVAGVTTGKKESSAEAVNGSPTS